MLGNGQIRHLEPQRVSRVLTHTQVAALGEEQREASDSSLYPSSVSEPPPPKRCPLSSFPGGSVVKNLQASAGDLGLIPHQGRSHMPRNSPYATTTKPALWSLQATTSEFTCHNY